LHTHWKIFRIHKVKDVEKPLFVIVFWKSGGNQLLENENTLRRAFVFLERKEHKEQGRRRDKKTCFLLQAQSSSSCFEESQMKKG